MNSIILVLKVAIEDILQVLGIDPAYGSSNFGIVITQFSDDVVQVSSISPVKNFTISDALLAYVKTHSLQTISLLARPHMILILYLEHNQLPFFVFKLFFPSCLDKAQYTRICCKNGIER